MEIEYKETNAALSISIKPLDKDIFGLAGKEFSQKLKICLLHLMVSITHFGKKMQRPST